MNSIIDEIKNMEESDSEMVKLDEGGHLPEFDGEWYCP